MSNCGGCGWSGHHRPTCRAYHEGKEAEFYRLQEENAHLEEGKAAYKRKLDDDFDKARAALFVEMKAAFEREVMVEAERRVMARQGGMFHGHRVY